MIMKNRITMPIHLALLCTLLAKRITYQLYNALAIVMCVGRIQILNNKYLYVRL